MKGDRVKGLFRWMGRQGRSGLWAVAILAVGLHLVLGVYLLRKHEFIPFKPLCWEDPGLWTLESAMHSVEGELSWEFFSALKGTLDEQGYNARLEVPNVYLTFVVWWDDNIAWNMTIKAVWKIVEERTGATWSDVLDDRIAVRGFDGTGVPDCETVRAIAIRDGKWEHEGAVTRIAKP